MQEARGVRDREVVTHPVDKAHVADIEDVHALAPQDRGASGRMVGHDPLLLTRHDGVAHRGTGKGRMDNPCDP